MNGGAPAVLHYLLLIYLLFMLIGICRGLAASTLGIVKVKTPLRNSAEAYSASTMTGRAIVRVTSPPQICL